MGQAQNKQQSWLRVERSGQQLVLALCGSWRLDHLQEISAELRSVSIGPSDLILIDGSMLEEIDTSGAMLVYHLLKNNNVSDERISHQNVRQEHLNLALLVKERLDVPQRIGPAEHYDFMERLGRATLGALNQARQLLSFIGETTSEAFRIGFRPGLLRMKELFVQLELSGINAIPIVALVNFLIGIVIAYLFGIQIEKYGANIFIVDAVSVAICRELSPILVAIIVAGRSGSAYTAQIGTMRLNEEIDAIVTLGLSPMQVLVIPRMLALVLAMPLLVFVGDVVGIMGGMLVADLRLDITGFTFIERLHNVLPSKHVLVGLVKAPVFAAFIAIIGCRMGLTVEKNARSVGINTTSTVVQSIVAVILLNAAFAIIFVELGI